ncbi:MAG: RHS repeat-associated core domain-containing protein [Myxococcota bacterium]
MSSRRFRRRRAARRLGSTTAWAVAPALRIPRDGPGKKRHGTAALGDASNDSAIFDRSGRRDDADYDGEDRLTSGGDSSLTYDYDGHVATVDGAALTYDALGRLVEDGTGGKPTHHDSELVGYEEDGTFFDLLGGFYGDAPLARSDGDTFEISRNRWGSSTGLVSGDGAVLGSTEWSPYGQRVASSGTQLPTGFKGYWYTGVASYHHAFARLYDAANRQFTVPDPLEGNGFSPSTMNRRGSFAGNPLEYTDLMGLTPGVVCPPECGDYTPPPVGPDDPPDPGDDVYEDFVQDSSEREQRRYVPYTPSTPAPRPVVPGAPTPASSYPGSTGVSIDSPDLQSGGLPTPEETTGAGPSVSGESSTWSWSDSVGAAARNVRRARGSPEPLSEKIRRCQAGDCSGFTALDTGRSLLQDHTSAESFEGGAYVGRLATGVYGDGLGGPAQLVHQVASHPVQTGQSVFAAVTNPAATFNAIYNGLGDFFGRLGEGDPRAIGSLVFTVATIGVSWTKGLQAGTLGTADDFAAAGGRAVDDVVPSTARGGGGGHIGGSSNGSNFVYRGLSSTDEVGGALKARAPGAGNSPISHVAGKRQSQWISTTRDPNVAIQKYGKNGVVQIDLNKVPGRVEDISGGIPRGGRMSNWAKADQEVLIQDFVPAEAIAPYNFSVVPR